MRGRNLRADSAAGMTGGGGIVALSVILAQCV
jgi:hypothetical protein